MICAALNSDDLWRVFFFSLCIFTAISLYGIHMETKSRLWACGCMASKLIEKYLVEGHKRQANHKYGALNAFEMLN